MELSEIITANNIIFALLSLMVTVGGFLAVYTEKLLHSAIYLFIALLGIAGMYLQMSYEFLAGVEVSVYAGGIVILFIFGIMMVHRVAENSEHVSCNKKGLAAMAAGLGALLVLITIAVYPCFGYQYEIAEEAAQYAENIDMQSIGLTLLGTDKHEYLLPFEATGILLLACIIGAIVIANKKKEEVK